MNFAHPSVLWMLAVAAPALAAFFYWAWRERRRCIAEFVPARLQASLTLGLSPRRARYRALLLIGAVAALLIALARPRYGAGLLEVNQRGLDILIAIDTSRSMLAEDAGPGMSRLERAKLAAVDLAQQAAQDRLGLIAFAGSAFLQCPLTIDDQAFLESIKALDTDVIPMGGSSLAAAIRTALETLKEDQSHVPVLVLITDGEEHESEALAAAERADKRGLRIFTIGVGTTSGEILRLRDEAGAVTHLKDQNGNVVKSSLNEELLRQVAERTGGVYLPLAGPRIMQELYERGLAPLPRFELASRRFEQFHERFQWPLALALVLLVIEVLLPGCSRVRGPSRPVQLRHPTLAGAVQTILLAGLLLAAAPRSSASAWSALRQLGKGEYQAALSEFERLLGRKPDDPQLRFNAGLAAYGADQLDQADENFSAALRSTDLDLQRKAFYNLGNTQYYRGEQAPDPSARARLWENAIRNFESALSIAPGDTNAQYNAEYVRQQLKDLQQKQPENQDPSKDKSSSDPSQQNAGNSDDSQESSTNAPPQKSQQDSQPKDGSSSPEQQGQQDQQAGQDGSSKQDDGESGQDQQSPSPQDKQDASKDSAGSQDTPPPSQDGQSGESPAGESGSASDAQPRQGEMTRQEALRLLDAARGDEQLVPLEKQRRARARVIKDW